jgi:hypothetical protein
MWFNRRRDPRVRDEIQFHRDHLVDDYMAAGMSRIDAERRAFREFGNIAQIEEHIKDVRGRWFEARSGCRELCPRTSRHRSPASHCTARGIGNIGSVIRMSLLLTFHIS